MTYAQGGHSYGRAGEEEEDEEQQEEEEEEEEEAIQRRLSARSQYNPPPARVRDGVIQRPVPAGVARRRTLQQPLQN